MEYIFQFNKSLRSWIMEKSFIIHHTSKVVVQVSETILNIGK